MKEKDVLEEYARVSSSNVLDSIRLLDVLGELTEDDAKLFTLIAVIRKKLKTAFDKIESSHEIILFKN